MTLARKASGSIQPLAFVAQAAQATVVATLCTLMTVSPVFAEGAADPAGVPTTVRTAPLTQQEKVLHALNRLTFGPRPGDEAMVEKMGLEAWFQQQLHPATIDDSALDARLAVFPAMKLSQSELIKRFPSQQMIRQMAQRGASLPSDPTLHAIYADSLAAYELGKARQEAGLPPLGQAGQAPVQPAAGNGDAAMMDGQTDKAMVATPAAQPTAQTAAKKKGIRGLEEPMSADEVNAVLTLPPDQRMAKILAMPPKEAIAFRLGMKPYQRPMLMAGLSPEQAETIEALQAPVRVVGAEATESRLVRDVYSERQLEAVMTDFWLNHFSVYVRKNQNEPYYLPAYEREAIRPNALGHFENLLVATAKSPAMLMYLDNWQSVGPHSQFAERAEMAKRARPNGQAAKAASGVNENYARELMELHTLGVGGGYTQKDVQEVAKVFTGWTIDKPYQGENGGEAVFDESRHEGGSKVVLGQTIKEDGSKEGMEVLHMLATSPATAKFISTKLAVRFVSDTPPPALVSRMADTFLKTNGDIKAVLSTMFHSPEFWSPAVYRAKVKTPIEFVASALRASGADVKNPLPLVQAMDRLGMPIYGMQTPNGYSWKQDEWVSSNALITRMNFALVLSGGKLPGTSADLVALLGDGTNPMAPTPATEKQLEALLLGEPAAQRTRATVLDQFNNPTAQSAAAQGFNQAKPASASMAAGDMGAADMAGGAVATTADGPDMYSGNKKGKGRVTGVNFAQNNQPETPLATMAGLLLGSPDFQRR